MSNGIGVKQGDDGIAVKGGGAGMRKPTRLPTPGMCFYHSEIPATYVCNKCGRAICVNCANKYGSLTFCPQCNPYPGGPPEPEEEPEPGRPGTFTAGAVGAVLVGIMSVIIPLLSIYVMFFDYDFDEIYYAYIIISTISMIIFMVGSIIMGIGYLGFSRTYKSHMGIVAMIFSIISPVLLLITNLFAYDYDIYDGYGYSAILLLWLGQIMLGVMLILMGTSTLLIGKHTEQRGRSIAAGVLLIISGGMFIGFLGIFGVAWFLLCAAAFVQAAVFLGAPGISKLKKSNGESDRTMSPPVY